jgi:hypothetical protein
MKITNAEERRKNVPKINIALFGPSGVGKTTQARTLDPDTTLFIDLEGGTLAISDWAGDTFDVRKQALELNIHPWILAKAIALLIGGPDPSDNNGDYSQHCYDRLVQHFPDFFGILPRYKTIFVDSITVASRQCFKWSLEQPAAVTERGQADTRGAYGLLGREMIKWATHLQHCPKDIIMSGILEEETDDKKRTTWVPQIEGSKTGRELPGIFDEVLTLQTFNLPSGKPGEFVTHRAFVCRQDNPYGYPAKDRSGCLEMLEAPDLGGLIRKIRAGKRLDSDLVTSMPTKYAEPATVTTPAPEAEPTSSTTKTKKTK